MNIAPAKILSTVKIRVRHSLVQWALSQTTLHIDGELKYKENVLGQLRPENYANNRMVRLLDIFCRLKAFAGESGLIKQRKSRMVEIAAFCECSINKLRPVINELNKMGWIHTDDYCIKINSERTIYRLCGLEYDRKVDRIFYKPEKIDNEKHTHYWLYLADIDDNRRRQAYTVHKKIIQNPELKLWLYGLLQQYNYNISQIESDAETVCKVLHNHYMQCFHGSKESEMYDWLCENRPDVNRGVAGMADAWNTLPINVSYIKKRFVEQKIAFVQKIGTITSMQRSRNKHIHIAGVDGEARPKGALWNKITKTTFQHFVDDIMPRITPIQPEKQQQKAAA